MQAARAIIWAGLALGLAAPQPAAADLAADGTAAWHRAVASGITPQTRDEVVLCALYWEQWGLAIEDYRLTDQMLAALPSMVGMKPAYAQITAWAERLARASGGFADADRMIDQALDRETPRVASEVAVAVSGDSASMARVMEMLAICRNP